MLPSHQDLREGTGFAVSKDVLQLVSKVAEVKERN
jgi:hypothetical protein